MSDPRKYLIDEEEAPGQVAVGASAVVVAANPHRTGLYIINISNPFYAISIAFGQAAVDMSGKVLTAYGSVYCMDPENLYLGDIYAVCPDGGLLSISEEVRSS